MTRIAGFAAPMVAPAWHARPERPAVSGDRWDPSRDADANRPINRQMLMQHFSFETEIQQSEFYQALDAGQQQALMELARRTSTQSPRMPPQVNPHLMSLLQSGAISPALLDSLGSMPPQLAARVMQDLAGDRPVTIPGVPGVNSQEHPEEYARLVAGLAGPDGAVRLANGQTVTRAQVLQATLAQNPAFRRLTPEQQQQVAALAAQVAPEDNPLQVSPALLRILERGQLLQRDANGQTLLHNLTGLSQQQFPDGLDGTAVLRQVLQHIAYPGSIQQHQRNTCTVTTLQIMLAHAHPAEYARLVADLTSQNGEAVLRHGDRIRRDPSTVGDDGSGRDDVSRIFQTSFMEYTNGLTIFYHNPSDTNWGLGTFNIGFTPVLMPLPLHTGQFSNNFNNTLNAVLPQQYALHLFNNQNQPIQPVVDSITQAVNQGHMVPIAYNVNGPDTAHQGVIVGMDGNVFIVRDPWGVERRFTAQDLQNQLLAYHLPVHRSVLSQHSDGF